MGVNWSYIDDSEQRKKCEYTYNLAMSYMIINVVVIFLPLTFLYWLNVFDQVNSAPAWFSVALVTMGFLMTNQVAFMSYPFREVRKLGIASSVISLLALIIAVTGAFYQHNASLDARNSRYGNSNFLTPVTLLAIALPVIYLIHMILFGFTCSALWKRMLEKREVAIEEKKHFRYSQSRKLDDERTTWNTVQFELDP